MGLPQWFSDKESACNAGTTGDMGSIPRFGQSLGGGHGNPLVFLPENPGGLLSMGSQRVGHD